MSAYESQQIDKLRVQQAELFKQQVVMSSQKQSKAQQKKEKQLLQAKNVIMPPDSMSLQSAILYLRNALIAIET